MVTVSSNRSLELTYNGSLHTCRFLTLSAPVLATHGQR
jgi:hypothetical protein